MLKTALLLVTLAASKSGNAQLDRAEQLCDELQLAACLSALDAAWATDGNPQPVVLRVLELQGITAASLGQPPRAQAALRQLFILNPDYPMRRDFAPRVMTQVFEARAWASSHGSLKVEALAPVVEGGTVRSVGVRVAEDPMTMVRAVRLQRRTGEGPWQAQVVPLGGDVAKVDVAGAREVQWFAEVLGERNRVLATVGDAKAPRVARAPEPVAKVRTDDVPTPTKAPAAATAAEAPPSKPAFFRPASYVLGGLAALSLAGGTYYGLASQDARSRLANAEKDADGRIIGLTQYQADTLNQGLQRNATLANGLFVAGGVLAGAGITFYLLGNDVQATPAPGGVTVQGRFQ